MSSSVHLFFDCDPGIDDAVALGYLFCQSDVNVIGIAAAGGNVPTDQVVANTRGWLELAGRHDIPIHRGHELPLAWQEYVSNQAAAGAAQPEYADLTHGATGTGYARLPEPSTAISSVPAARAWVEAARAHPGRLIGVVTGPATNLAMALDLDPELPSLLDRLFIMGGAFNYRGNTRPTTEWNTTFDPESTSRVLAAFDRSQRAGTLCHLPVIAPIEATEAVEMTPERLTAILDGPSAPDVEEPRSAVVSSEWRTWLDQMAEALRFYFEFHEWDGLGYIAHIHDPFILACALEWARRDQGSPTSTPTNGPIPIGTRGTLPWARTVCAPVDVELTGTLTRGETVADWLGRWEKDANAEIIRSIDAQAFLDHLGDTLNRGPHHDHEI